MQQTFAQSIPKSSRPEKCWALFHPFVAKKAYRITVEAYETAKQVAQDKMLDGDGNGGQADAFRHAYWMALLSQKIKPNKARKLGKAHEKGNYIFFKKGRLEEGTPPDSMACVMDLYNNEVGIGIGQQNKKISKEELKQIVLRYIFQRNMRILKKDPQGNFLDCSGKIIDPAAYNGKWNIPKCLTESAK